MIMPRFYFFSTIQSKSFELRVIHKKQIKNPLEFSVKIPLNYFGICDHVSVRVSYVGSIFFVFQMVDLSKWIERCDAETKTNSPILVDTYLVRSIQSIPFHPFIFTMCAWSVYVSMQEINKRVYIHKFCFSANRLQ